MADKVNLQKSYSALNERLAKLFDESGVRRSFTVPYIDGQTMDQHVESVGQAAVQSGGITGNLLTSAHHSTGKGWGSGDGQTVGHPSEKLRTTVVPKDDENAKAAVSAASTHLNNLEKLLGEDDPAVKSAKGQLQLVKQTDGAGMTLLDFGVMLTQIMYGPTQAVARAHSGNKDGGHAPHLRAPGQVESQNAQDSQTPPAGDDQMAENAPEAPEPAAGAPAAPGAPATAPQAQG